MNKIIFFAAMVLFTCSVVIKLKTKSLHEEFLELNSAFAHLEYVKKKHALFSYHLITQASTADLRSDVENILREAKNNSNASSRVQYVTNTACNPRIKICS